MTPADPYSAPRIGVFDSGLGGLSVLRAIRQRLPRARLLYVADSGHAPYGERGDDYVCERSLAIAAFLKSQGAQILVIACNTATAAAASSVRTRYPDGLIVGVEPGVKPAASLTRNGRVGVMATTGTLRSERFRLLALAHAAHIDLRLQPCPGLAAAIESGQVDAGPVRERVAASCAPLREQDVDTVVLGCTHYPFVAHHIQAEMGPNVQLVDTSEAVARRTESLCAALPPAPVDRSPAAAAPARLWTTGDARTLHDFVERWLDFDCLIETLDT
ncbi:glutamate racemase [Sphaerotilus hippei]|uniref:Glutamate racemase n=1 Tax=Sphaerotilus hippei TaxID=744406 RepID=A0A318GYE0_9BURK|nr:glutamate racemase [Sphaerotilus hippei]PXW95047.1 glutamate racemase [Sphaerotilus hippei]